MKNKYILVRLFVCLLVIHTSTICFALPSNSKAGHRDLTKMSADIKRGLDASKSNGLQQALGGTEKIETEKFNDRFSSASVAEDSGINPLNHFYDPATGEGFLGLH